MKSILSYNQQYLIIINTTPILYVLYKHQYYISWTYLDHADYLFLKENILSYKNPLEIKKGAVFKQYLGICINCVSHFE